MERIVATTNCFLIAVKPINEVASASDGGEVFLLVWVLSKKMYFKDFYKKLFNKFLLKTFQLLDLLE